jgi:hypothetical protein
MALASAALSYKGIIPAPRVVMAVNTIKDGWVVLPAEGRSFEAYQPSAGNEAVSSFIEDGNSYWSHTGEAQSDESFVTWFIGGTPPNWQAAPLALVVLLEEKNPKEAQQIGQSLLLDAMNP